MKERPILFSTLMVQAILEGRKTMTRRIVKPQPDEDDNMVLGLYHPTLVDSYGDIFPGTEKFGLSNEHYSIPGPYGKPGDVLWIRETWRPRTHSFPTGYAYEYKATAKEDGVPVDEPWKPSIFMPRQASRITLEITNVRVERLQDISDEDAVKEGIEVIHMAEPTVPIYKRYDLKENKGTTNPFLSFQTLWKSINGKDSWDANPWVWVIEFKKINE